MEINISSLPTTGFVIRVRHVVCAGERSTVFLESCFSGFDLLNYQPFHGIIVDHYTIDLPVSREPLQ